MMPFAALGIPRVSACRKKNLCVCSKNCSTMAPKVQIHALSAAKVSALLVRTHNCRDGGNSAGNSKSNGKSSGKCNGSAMAVEKAVGVAAE